MFDLDITEEKSLLALTGFTESSCGGILETCLAFYSYLGQNWPQEIEYLKKYIDLKKSTEKDNLVFDINKVSYVRQLNSLLF